MPAGERRRDRVVAPWDTTTGATDAYTGSAGQISALTSALTSVDLPFLNSPTTTIVTPVRRMLVAVLAQAGREVRATRPLGDLDDRRERVGGRILLGRRRRTAPCARPLAAVADVAVTGAAAAWAPRRAATVGRGADLGRLAGGATGASGGTGAAAGADVVDRCGRRRRAAGDEAPQALRPGRVGRRVRAGRVPCAAGPVGRPAHHG